MRVTVQISSDSVEMIDLADDATLQDLKAAFTARTNKDINRVAFKLVPSGNGNGDSSKFPTLKEGPLRDQKVTLDGTAVLRYKDLGMQIPYRSVFVAEYLGPLLFSAGSHFLKKQTVAAAGGVVTQAQDAMWAMVSLHFAKRLLETFFVHKFSRPTMPISNLFKNCTYYFSFTAVICAFMYNEAQNTAAIASQQTQLGLIATWAGCQLLNFIVHFQLANTRSGDGDKTRKVPTGGLFALCCCPNYFFEVSAWTAFSAYAYATGYSKTAIAGTFFTLVGAAQMTQWALEKKAGYVKQDARNKTRAAIFPLFI